jgi:hypothetical protein
MPPISERVGVQGMEPATPTQPNQAPVAMHPPTAPQGQAGGFMRCPIPAGIYTTNVDSINHFNKYDKYPQTRIYTQS